MDGQGTASAQEHVAAGFGPELAAILRLHMVARIAWAMQAKHATCEFAEVRFAFIACIYRLYFDLVTALTHSLIYIADGLTEGSTLDGGWSQFGAC